MGGTFDPIHHGHLVAASEVAARLGLDQVIFVPTGEPPQKPNVTNSEDRYLMTVIATASNPRFNVSRVDIDRDGPTYTVDTLKDIQAEYPDAELFFISGADAIAQILSWKDFDKLWQSATFVAVSRPGHTMQLPELAPAGAIEVLEVPALSISSTDVRRRAANGDPVWYLVPDGVVQYINKHKLYRGANA
jgi:nicotinate-nucleotide adenylyltransferase